jgi:hypothetical protein
MSIHVRLVHAVTIDPMMANVRTYFFHVKPGQQLHPIVNVQLAPVVIIQTQRGLVSNSRFPIACLTLQTKMNAASALSDTW